MNRLAIHVRGARREASSEGPHQTRAEPPAEALALAISSMQIALVEWSLVASALIPHRMSTGRKLRPREAHTPAATGKARLCSALRSAWVSVKVLDKKTRTSRWGTASSAEPP